MYEDKRTLTERLEEILIVISVSKKTQLAIFLAFFFPALILLCGFYAVANFELSGQFTSMEGVIKEAFAKRYDKVALGAFVGFIVLAFKIYPKEKKRIF